MSLKNLTKNQHFVPQAEQRLNSLNPAAKEENQRIFAFDVIDREKYIIKLRSPKGQKISSSLSLHDLFSFDVLEQSSQRYNFEKLFCSYELRIKSDTSSLLDKLTLPNASPLGEVVNIFRSKMLNFVRNPYSIKKILNTFPPLRNLQPTDPIHLSNYKRVLHGKKPHQEHLCRALGISEADYTEWLGILFLLLEPLADREHNFLDQTIKNLIEDPKIFCMIMVYSYDQEKCLLSDRGYSTPLPDDNGLTFDFNLSSKNFIRFIFANVLDIAPPQAPKEIIESFISRPKTIDIHHLVNDLPALAKYNRNVVYQCHHAVYSATTNCYGLV